MSFLPKIRIEVVVATEQADKTVEIMAEAARTGQIGDDKTFVMPVEKAIRIRTGEMDAARF